MKMGFVKICGIANKEDALAVAALEPDAMGFNMHEASPRFIDPAELEKWIGEIPDSIQKVGVFLDHDLEKVKELSGTLGLDIIQLHGHEDAAYCAALKKAVWKVLHLDMLPAEFQSYPVDAFLLDSYTATARGGTGKTVDWPQAERFVEETTRPVLLAGGLNPENVPEAISVVRPRGVDVSSGVEMAPGKKSIEKVAAFIKASRAAYETLSR